MKQIVCLVVENSLPADDTFLEKLVTMFNNSDSPVSVSDKNVASLCELSSSADLRGLGLISERDCTKPMLNDICNTNVDNDNVNGN